MFKNLVISIMGSWIITNMNFWIYDDAEDKILIFLTLTFVLFIAVFAIEDAIKSYKRKRYIKQWRVDRFKDVVKQNTTQASRVQECDELIRMLEDTRRRRG